MQNSDYISFKCTEIVFENAFNKIPQKRNNKVMRVLRDCFSGVFLVSSRKST